MWYYTTVRNNGVDSLEFTSTPAAGFIIIIFYWVLNPSYRGICHKAAQSKTEKAKKPVYLS